MKRIGILTSGGDAPGMNACIRAVVRAGIQKGFEVYGIYSGFEGMIEGSISQLTTQSVSNIIQRGGTILKTSRSERFKTEEGMQAAYEQLKKLEIDAVIAIGGDGTFKGATIFSQEYKIPFIGIPGTIDNDLFGTEFTIGYDTAINTAVELIDKVRDTANSLGRLFFIEVMGRDVGTIALVSGLASGAEDILIPEIKTDLKEISEKLKNSRQKESYIIVVAEGDDAGGVVEIAAKFRKMHPEYDIKTLVLGHLQRGGNPSANDRILASRLGVAAIDAIIDKNLNVVVGIHNNKVLHTPLNLAVKHFLTINEEWKELMYLLSY